nr:immunoglobulin heavy chain junction region [Macaca mulatta]
CARRSAWPVYNRFDVW